MFPWNNNSQTPFADSEGRFLLAENGISASGGVLINSYAIADKTQPSDKPQR